MTFPREIKSYTEEPRVDALLTCIRVPFRLYFLPTGQTDVGRGFLQVLLQTEVSLSLATWPCVSIYKSPQWAKEETGTWQLAL